MDFFLGGEDVSFFFLMMNSMPFTMKILSSMQIFYFLML